MMLVSGKPFRYYLPSTVCPAKDFFSCKSRYSETLQFIRPLKDLKSKKTWRRYGVEQL